MGPLAVAPLFLPQFTISEVGQGSCQGTRASPRKAKTVPQVRQLLPEHRWGAPAEPAAPTWKRRALGPAGHLLSGRLRPSFASPAAPSGRRGSGRCALDPVFRCAPSPRPLCHPDPPVAPPLPSSLSSAPPSCAHPSPASPVVHRPPPLGFPVREKSAEPRSRPGFSPVLFPGLGVPSPERPLGLALPRKVAETRCIPACSAASGTAPTAAVWAEHRALPTRAPPPPPAVSLGAGPAL